MRTIKGQDVTTQHAGLAESAQKGERQTITGTELEVALQKKDAVTLDALKGRIMKDLGSNDMGEIGLSLSFVASNAETNIRAGLPLAFSLNEAQTRQLQQTLVETASRKTELEPPYGINTAQVYTESVGKLVRQGILKISGGFERFASPVIGTLEGVSPLAAAGLRHAVTYLSDPIDQVVEEKAGEAVAKRSAKEIFASKLDGDIGGRKPAAKSGPMLRQFDL